MRALALFAGVAAAGVPAALLAQTGAAPTLSEVLARLNAADVAFNATIDEIPGEEIVKAGQQVAMSNEVGNGSYAPCFTCHGVNGSGNAAGGFPKLAALPAPYLLDRLEDYASGADANEIMSPIAAALSEEERAAVAVWYALQPPTVGVAMGAAVGEADAELLQHGARLSAIGSDEAMIPACANCHGIYGSGIPPAVPPLAGQVSAYIVEELKAFASGERPAAPTNPMPQVAEKMSERDMEAVGAYFQALQPPEDLAVETSLELTQNRPLREGAPAWAEPPAAVARP